MSEPLVSNERLLLLLTDLRRDFNALQTRHDAMEYFIKKEFPEYFAGEADTVVDPELKPIPIVYGEPQESNPKTWKENANVKQG